MDISQLLSMGSSRATRLCKAFIVAVVTSLVAAMCVVVQPAVAQARSECSGGGYSNLHWKSGSPGVENEIYTGRSDQAQVEFDWEVPNSATKGDTFYVQLPEELVTVNTGKLELKDSSDQVVAEANIAGKSKKVEFTLTDFADKHFSVKGKAFFTVEWDRSSGNLPQNGFGQSDNPGTLIFGGCGNGNLKGIYLPDGPVGITHESGKNGQYFGLRKVNGKNSYLFSWAIFVGSNTGISEFSVTDTPPPGHKFACDSDHVIGKWSPIFVDAITGTGHPQENVIQIPGGVRHSGTHNLKLSEHAKKQQWDSVRHLGTYGFDINCQPNSVTVRFPYGVDPNSGPRIFLISYADEEPAAGSRITNKASINGKDVEGSVVIPSAGGWAEGKLGGFAFRKQATGLERGLEKSFDFEWTCHHKDNPGKETSKGNKSLKSGESHHVSDQDKGTICNLKEKNADVEGYGRVTKWIVNGKTQESESVEVEASAKNEQAAIIEVTNSYTKKEEKPKTGSFKVTKKVKGLSVNHKDIQYPFTYTCAKEGADTKSGNFTITGEGEQVIDNIPAGYSCSVTEDTEKATVKGYSLVANVSGPVTIVADQTQEILVNNLYSQGKGSFSITKELQDPSNIAAGKKFSFEYECENKDLNFKTGGIVGPIGAGEKATVKDIPAGSICTIKERDAKVPGADLKVSGLDESIIVGNDEKNVKVTNTYSVWRANIVLSKKITGSSSSALLEKPFEVDYVCVLGTRKSGGKVTVTAKTPIVISDLRSGSECTFTENTKDLDVKSARFNPAGSTTKTTVKVGDKGTNVSAKLINDYKELGKVSLTKVIGGLSADAWGSTGQNPREFDVEVTYKDASGDNKTQTLKVSEGKITQLPALPAGTEIKIREIMPNNSALTTWSTPGYSSADGSAVVRDNGDGSATIIVPANSFDKPALVKVRNTANIPWWWSLLILVPFVVPHLVPSDSGSSSSATSTSTPQKPAAPSTQQPAPVKEKQKPKKTLAVTGASVHMVLIFGLILTMTGGAFFVMRRRQD
ncbi:LPxTG domain-containing protein [Corynebacterium pseudotuberculosis]|nr:LPxTG domain-containing protein [Corynebacterium pseudotuberculosis]